MEPVMSSLVRLLAALSLGIVGSTVVGCGTNQEAFDTGIDVGSGTLRCKATISPAELEYRIDAAERGSGESDVLRFTDVDTGVAGTMSRIGQDGYPYEPSTAPYGLWRFSVEDDGPVHIDNNLLIRTDRVVVMSFCSIEGRTVRALAESAAEVTDGRIRLFDFAEDEVTLAY
jgi:hypothetical protein